MRDWLTVLCAWFIGITVGAFILLALGLYCYLILRVLFWIGGY